MWESIEELSPKPMSWQGDDGPSIKVTTERMKVPCGWIVRTLALESKTGSISVSTSMVFVPDATHEWKPYRKA